MLYILNEWQERDKQTSSGIVLFMEGPVANRCFGDRIRQT